MDENIVWIIIPLSTGTKRNTCVQWEYEQLSSLLYVRSGPIHGEEKYSTGDKYKRKFEG